MSHRSQRPPPQSSKLKTPSNQIQSSKIPTISGAATNAVTPRTPMTMKSTPPARSHSRRSSSASEEDVFHRSLKQSVKQPVSQRNQPSAQSRSAAPQSSLPRSAGSSNIPSGYSKGINYETVSSNTRLGQSPADARPRNVLRRKAPSIEQYAMGSRAQPGVSNISQDPPVENLPKGAGPPPDRSRYEVHYPPASLPSQSRPSPSPIQSPPQNTPNPPPNPQTSSIPKEFRGLAATSHHGRHPPQPTPSIPTASSPSTLYSDSPGPWSSRTSTPTSISSYSPGFLQPTKAGSRLKQPSPVSSGNTAQPRTGRYPSPLNTTAARDTRRTPSRTSESPQRAPHSRNKTPTEGQIKVETPARTPPPARPSSKPEPSGSWTHAVGPDTKRRHEKVPDTPKDQVSRTAGSFDEPRQTAATPPHPSRPSRKGTGDLQLETSPVIRSNLTSSRLPGHTRQRSREIADTASSRYHSARPPNTSVESLQSTSSSRIPHPPPSPKPGSLSARRPSGEASSRDSRSFRRNSTSVNNPEDADDSKRNIGGDSSKRFGIFTKKSKTVPEVTAADRGDKQTRKGPSAGTGHEGYGRYAQRGRRPSTGSSTGRARSTSTSASTSQTSLTSRTQPGMDDFLRDRLEPIILSGGGSDGAELSRTQSGQSVASTSTTSTTSFAPYAHPGEDSSDSLGSYGGPLSHSPESFEHVHQQGERKSPKKNVLVKRRSLRKPQVYGGENKHQAISSSQNVSRPSIDKPNSSVGSLARNDAPTPGTDKEEKKEKKKKSEKWPKLSFFQRSHHVQRKEPEKDLRTAARTEVHVSVNKVPAQKQQPHYAMLDNEQVGSDTLEDILRRIEDSPPSEGEDGTTSEPPVGLGLKKPHGPSVLLPDAPKALMNYNYDKSQSYSRVFFRKDSIPENTVAKEAEIQPEPKPRTTRLASVGRIPKVVPRDDAQQQNQATQSFSRPFSRGEPVSTIPAADNPGSLALPSYRPEAPGYPTPPDIPSDYFGYPPSGQEFFSFPPRDSTGESTSSSSGHRVSLSAFTAVVPSAGSKLTDDEVWGEYDELLDHVTSPGQESPQISSRRPFRMATEASKALQEGLNEVEDDPAATSPSLHSKEPRVASTSTATDNDKSSIHLRRSMVASALHSSLTPSTAMSFGEFYNDGAESSKASPMLGTQPSSNSMKASRLPPTPPTEKLPPRNEENRKRNTALLDLAERNKYGLLAQANLRSGSLMTSRWLSFGRVLFSPAQNHVQSQEQSRILVIDGSGNDDWSFYCALTYPAATVYSLSVSKSGSASSNPAAWDPPSNHRTVNHANIEHPFPFPKGFFAVAIVRFPAASSEAELRATVSECKRVLRPGAYLELSILDLDMVNMGSRARKAVRNLKEQMYTTDSSLSLKPASDNIQRLLGKRGFENLNRCMVVVPVAGSIMASSETSSSNHSIKFGSMSSAGGNPKAQQQRQRRAPSDDANVSLGDLLTDSSDSSSTDESIAKMVAKVGRWWYTRCYESAVLLDGNLDNSMWSDKRLLRECQRRGTGFKLLIAYAQKPSELPRRTVSV